MAKSKKRRKADADKRKKQKQVKEAKQAKQQQQQEEEQRQQAEKQKKDEDKKKETIDKAKGMVTTFSQSSLSAIVSFGKASISAASEFEKSMSTIQSATGATNQQMQATRQISQNLFGQNVGQGWEDIGNSIMITSELTGQQGAALEHTTKDALLLKDAFGYDVADSVNSANALMKKFGITSDQAFGLIAQGQAKATSVNGEMLNQAQQAITGLQQMKFSTPGAAMETLKKQISVDVLIPVGEKLLPVLQSFSVWLTSHEPLIRSFGAALANNVGQAVSLVAAGLNKVEPILDFLAAGAINIWNSFSHWSGFVPVVSGIVGALAFFLTTVKAISLATKVWTAANLLLEAVMEANPIMLIVTALVGLGIALVVAYKKCAAFRNLVNGVWEALRIGFSATVSFFTDMIPKEFSALGKSIAGLWNRIAAWMRGIPQLLNGIFAPFVATLGTGAVLIYQTFFAPIVSFVQMIPGQIFGFLSTVTGFILNAWTFLKNGTVAVFMGLLNFEIFIWTTIWNTLVGIVSQITAAVSAGWNLLRDTTVAALSMVASYILGVWSSLAGGITGAFSGIGSFFTGIWDNIQAIFMGGINWVIDRINGLIEALNGVMGIKLFGKQIGITIPTLNHVGNETNKNDPGQKKGAGVAGVSRGLRGPVAGSFAKGLANVPYNGFVAELHKGERVLTAEENKSYGNTGGASLAPPVRGGAVGTTIGGSGGQQMNINLTVDVKGGSMDASQTSDLIRQFRLAMQQVFQETMRRSGIEGGS